MKNWLPSIGSRRPTDAFGQFADRGDSYRPVIFTIVKNKSGCGKFKGAVAS